MQGRRITNKIPINAKRDCASFHNGGCTALVQTFCEKEACKFYKTERQLKAELERIRERIPDYQMYRRKDEL